MSDWGAMTFDTRVRTDDTRKQLAALQQEFYDVTSAMKSQIHTVKDLEDYYKALEESSKRAMDPERVEKLNKEMAETGAKLEKAREKLIELRVESNKMKETVQEFTQSAQTMGASLTSLGKRILGLARRVFIFTVVARAFNSLRNLIVDSIPGIADLQASFNELKIAIVRAAAPLISAFIPVLKATIKYIVILVNTIRQAITAILSLFGADVADDAEVTEKATNSLTGSVGKLGKAGKKASKDLAQFDEIMQIGTNAAKDADLGEMQKEAQIASEAIKPLTALEEVLAKLSLFSIAGILGGKEGLGIALTIEAIGEAIEAYGDIIENGVNWENLTKNFQSDMWLLIGGALLGGGKGVGIAAVINGVKDAVEAAQDIMKNGINWQNLLLNFQSDTWTFIGGAVLGGKKGAGVAAIINAVKDAAEAAQDMFKNGLNWGNLLLNFQSDIWSAIGGAALGGGKGIGIAAVINAIKDSVLAAKDILENGLNWGNLLLNYQANLWAIIGGATLGGGKGIGIALLLTGIKDTILSVKDIIENGINWENVGLGLRGVVKALEGLFLLLTVGKLSSGESLVAGLKGALATAGLIIALEEMIKLFKDISENGLTWENAIKGIALAIDIATLAMLAFGATVSPIQIAIAAIATLAAIVVENWEKIKKVVGTIWNWIKEKMRKLKEWFEGTWLGKAISWLKGINKKDVNINTKSTTQMLPNTRNPLTIPALASGAVIPPNNPYLAVVGDQTSGTNIETPLQTMVDAFKQALAETGYGKAVMEVDGTTFAQLVYKYNSAETARVGVNLLTKE